MRTLTIIFFILGVLASCRTSPPLVAIPTLSNDRRVDSCEVFSRLLQANMIFHIGSAGRPEYSIRGEWAKRSRKYPKLFNVEADFIDYRNCIIGLTTKELRDLLGKPSYIEMGYNTYFYIRRDTSSIRTPTMYRLGCIDITLRDTIRSVSHWADCIRIE